MIPIKEFEPWGLDQQQTFHNEALQIYGEKILARRVWTAEDFQKGLVTRCTTCSAGISQNEKQAIDVKASGGTFTLTFNAQTTSALAWNIDAAALQTALEGLSSIGVGNVTAIGGPGGTTPFTIEFIGVKAKTEQTLITANSALLTGSPAYVSILEAQLGQNQQSDVASVYQQPGDVYCTDCYGTGFTGGFEPTIYLTYAIFTDETQDVNQTREGVVFPKTPQGDFSHTPDFEENDLFVRVRTWDANGTAPADGGEEGRYLFREVKPITLRTSPALPIESLIVGQRAPVTRLPDTHHLQQVPVQ